jgi:hypothetical protein
LMGEDFDEGFLAEGKMLEGDCWRGKMNCWRENCWREDCWREKNCQRGIAKERFIELVGSLWGNGFCWLSASLRAETLRKLRREHGTVQVCMKNFIHML